MSHKKFKVIQRTMEEIILGISLSDRIKKYDVADIARDLRCWSAVGGTYSKKN